MHHDLYPRSTTSNRFGRSRPPHIRRAEIEYIMSCLRAKTQLETQRILYSQVLSSHIYRSSQLAGGRRLTLISGRVQSERGVLLVKMDHAPKACEPLGWVSLFVFFLSVTSAIMARIWKVTENRYMS